MRKVTIAVLILFVIAGLGGTGYFYMQYNSTKSEKDVLVKQNGELQGAIDAIGPVTTTYTVKAQMTPGLEIKEEDLVKQTTPLSSVNKAYITNPADVVGKYYKITVNPGTSLTIDLVIAEEGDTIYERDMTFTYLPLGIQVGDYIDIRMVLPYGEEFIVIEHKRIEKLVLAANTVKLKLSEAELALWTSALTDHALWNARGLSIYVTKYIEPGIATVAVPFYPVRQEMESVVTLNPNIKDKSVCINSTLRKEFDKKLRAITVEDSSNANTGKVQEASNINAAKESYSDSSSISADNSTGSTPASGNVTNVSDPTIQAEIDSLEEVGDEVTLDPVDSDGNTSSVTNDEVNASEGGDVYSDEDVIE